MFANGWWGGNIRVPGTSAPATDLTPLLDRLTALEATDVNHQVQMDDLGLALNALQNQINGNVGAGDDPGMVGSLQDLETRVTLMRADVETLRTDLNATNGYIQNEVTPAVNTAYTTANDAMNLVHFYHPIIGD